jgi:hypothetical protein
MNALFPFSVTLATAASAALFVSAADQSDLDFEAHAFALLGVLVALGALEHWFMMLPVSVVDLWRWSVRSGAERTSPALPVGPNAGTEPKAVTEPKAARPFLAITAGSAAMAEARESAGSTALVARQRLEEQFRQAYRASKASDEAPPVVPELAGGVQQTISTGINRTADGRTP